jgi:predicted nucleic acid-binding protein
VKTLVVDASVGVKWQLDDEEHVDKAEAIKRAFVRRALTLMVPVIFAVEWANALNVAIARGRFPAEAWREALADLEGLQLSVENPPGLLSEAWQLARVYGRTVYDGLYLALAKLEHCEMVTGDRKLFNAVSSHLDWVCWIGDYVVEDEERNGPPEAEELPEAHG